MIKTDSPYYIPIPWIDPNTVTISDSFVLRLYVIDGDKSTPATTPTQEIEKTNFFGLDNSTSIDVSDYINSEIPFTLLQGNTTGIQNSDSQVWLFWDIVYTVGGVEQTPTILTKVLCTRGYGNGIEGMNPTTTLNGLLAEPIDYNVNKGGSVFIPFEASETITTEISLVREDATTVFSKAATTVSGELVQMLYVDLSEYPNDEYIEILYNDTLITTLEIKEEQKFTPLEIAFRNKEGQLQTFTFFREKKDVVSFAGDSYENSVGQPIDGVHQFKDFNTNARSSFLINTGWISEESSEVLKQILLSDVIWITNGTNYTPINRDQKALEIKKRINDKLINYEIGFKYSYNEKNNI